LILETLTAISLTSLFLVIGLAIFLHLPKTL